MRYSFPALSGEGFGHEPGSWLRQKNANIEYWNAYRSDPTPYFKFTPKTTIASLLFGVVIPVALLKWTVAERDRIDEKKIETENSTSTDVWNFAKWRCRRRWFRYHGQKIG